MNGKHYRPKSGVCYENEQAAADAVKGEIAYAEYLNKDFSQLTQAERLAAVDFEPPEPVKPKAKKTRSSSPEEIKSTETDEEDK